MEISTCSALHPNTSVHEDPRKMVHQSVSTKCNQYPQIVLMSFTATKINTLPALPVLAAESNHRPSYNTSPFWCGQAANIRIPETYSAFS